MRDVLRPEVTAGVITDDELEALVGTRKQRRTFVKSQQGRRERRTAKHVLEAAHDLADQIAAAHGDDTPAVRRARAEVADVRT
jgi:protease PrsW